MAIKKHDAGLNQGTIVTLALDEMRHLGWGGEGKMTIEKVYVDGANRITWSSSDATDLKTSVEIMKKYLLLKFKLEDWHGVADAANDIREMIARKS